MHCRDHRLSSDSLPTATWQVEEVTEVNFKKYGKAWPGIRMRAKEI